MKLHRVILYLGLKANACFFAQNPAKEDMCALDPSITQILHIYFN